MKCSLYIHIPFCLQKCAYCDFYSVTSQFHSIKKRYFSSLAVEIEDKVKRFGIDAWSTIYIGGGTPSILSPSEIISLTELINKSAPDTAIELSEWAIEANPEDITSEWLSAASQGGINRLSVGIQSLQDETLSFIGRRGSVKTTLSALDLISKEWKGEVSFDMISGLPFQTATTLKEDLSLLCGFSPHHLSLYSLTLDEATPLYAKRASLPTEETEHRMWQEARDLLEQKGYRQYEISNFAKEGHESKHNLTYWRMGNWCAIGPCASMTVSDRDAGIRETNVCDLPAWLENPISAHETEQLSRIDCMKESLMMGMRLSDGLDKKAFRNRYNCDILDVAGATIQAWVSRGHMYNDESTVRLTKDGLFLLNRFLAEAFQELE